MFTSFLLVKFSVAIVLVITMSLIAEYASPKIAGIISGYPTGTAISLFFYGIEQSPEYASQSAIFNMFGLTALCVFITLYYFASLKHKHFLLPSLFAIGGYCLSVLMLNLLPKVRILAIILPFIAALICITLFRKIDNSIIGQKTPLRMNTLLSRAIIASVILLLITWSPLFFDSRMSGLFSAFPSTLFPLMIIIHKAYGKEHVHTIIKNVPIGLFSLILYSLVVSFLYPVYGVYLGTLFAYLAATAFILVFLKILPRF